MSISTSTKRAFRIGAGVAALVGLGLAGTGAAQAAPGFDPGASEARVGGANRYATAAQIAEQSWTSAATVIIANGETNGIDALSASYLAGLKDAPILLTQKDSVPAETAAALKKLNPSTVIVVGGEPSVSASTFAALTAGRTPQRIAGVDRYDTAAKIVEAGQQDTTKTLAATTLATGGSAFVVRGDLYGDSVAADALAASPVAFRAHVPIVLVSPNQVPTVSLNLLKTLKPSSLFAIGDTKAVSASVESSLRTELGLLNVSRLQGIDRTETAAAIATSQVAKDAGFGNTAVGIANGYKIDALAAGPAAGKAGYPLLLTESATSLGSGTRAYLEANKATLTSAKVFGDASSVSSTATDAARGSAGGTVTPPVTTPPVTTPPVTTPPVTTPPVTTPVGDPVDVQFAGLQGGTNVFSLGFSGAIQEETLAASDISITRAGVDRPHPASVVYDTRSFTAVVTLARGEFIEEGDVVTFAAGSVNSAAGAPSPASAVNATVELPFLPAGVVSDPAPGKVELDLAGALPPGATLIVTERAGDPDRTESVLDEAAGDRNLTVDGTSVSFDAPTAPGAYWYSVQAVVGDSPITQQSRVFGAFTVQPQILVLSTDTPSVQGGTSVEIDLGRALADREGIVLQVTPPDGDALAPQEPTDIDGSTLTVTAPSEEGEYKYRIWTRLDGAESEVSNTLTLMVDDTPPALPTLDRGSLLFVSADDEEAFPFTGMAVGATSIEIALSGRSFSNIAVDQNGVFDYAADLGNLQDGTYPVTLTARDAADNVTEITQQVLVVDRTNPTLDTATTSGGVFSQENDVLTLGFSEKVKFSAEFTLTDLNQLLGTNLTTLDAGLELRYVVGQDDVEDRTRVEVKLVGGDLTSTGVETGDHVAPQPNAGGIADVVGNSVQTGGQSVVVDELS